MTTLHGSTPSPWRRAEGCVPPEDFLPTRGCICGPSELPWSRLDSTIPSLVSFLHRSDREDMDSQVVTVDHFAATMASIQEAIANLGQRIDGQQAQQTEVTPPLAIVPTPISEDPHTRMDRLEQKLRQMRTSEGAITWEDFDGTPVASLPPSSGCLKLRDTLA
ncbi:hypothetical protein AAG906_016609 [Vitis piasezkii]